MTTTFPCPLRIAFPKRLKPPLSPDLLPPKSHLHLQLLRPQSASSHAGTTSPAIHGQDAALPPLDDADLLSLLRLRKTDAAFDAYARSTHLPGPVCLSRLVAQLSYQKTPLSLSRAQSIVRRLRDEDELGRLDANSLGLLAASAARAGYAPYALSLIRHMLRAGYLPHVRAWSAVASRLAAAPDDGPAEALRLFSSVTKRVRALRRHSPAGVGVESDAAPDTGAFNAALNACANLGDTRTFARLFLEEMPEFGVAPDVLTYNVAMKLYARAERRDLVAAVLETIVAKGILPCKTTFHSLVAAYVGLDELETAEKLVQAMREGRVDLCAVLRESQFQRPPLDDLREDEREVHLLLERLAGPVPEDPPLLPRKYDPDARMYTTLMKGYMKQGRVEDVVRTAEAMRGEPDPGSHPDHVTYTTVITALVNKGLVERAHDVLEEMARTGVPANRVTYNVLLKGYCQQHKMERAKELATEMAGMKGIEPNVVTYNTLIDGCILVDDSEGALAYFNEMRERGIAPSKVSYTTLMKAFVVAGQVKLVEQVFEEMLKDPRVKVDRAAWNMLLDGYCKRGLIDEAKKVVEKMKSSGMEPDIATYGSLASCIALTRKPGEALLLWNEVKERCNSSPPLKPDEGLLEPLADICVRAAFFQKALEIVACMEEHGIAPNKTKYKRIYIEMHSQMFTSKHASQARQDRRRERKRAAEAFKFWLGLPNSYYGSEWRLEPLITEE